MAQAEKNFLKGAKVSNTDLAGVADSQQILPRSRDVQLYSHAYVNTRETWTHGKQPNAFEMGQRLNSHFEKWQWFNAPLTIQYTRQSTVLHGEDLWNLLRFVETF